MRKKVSVPRLLFLISLYSLAANFAHPITPTLIQNLHLHDYMFGVAFACMALTNFLFSPFWGKISKGFGYARTAGFCFLGYAAAQALFGFALTEGQIIFARLLGGFFISGISVTQILYIMENSPAEKQGEDLASCAALTAVFSAFGYMVGGFIGDVSIKAVFFCQVVGLSVTGLLFWFILADSTEKQPISLKEIGRQSNPFQSFKDAAPLLSGVILMFLISSAAASFASTCYEQCFNYFIKDQYGFPPSYNGLLKAAVGFITLFFNSTLCVVIMRKTDTVKSIVPILFGCFITMGAIVLCENVIVFLIINVIFFGVSAIVQPILQAMIGRFSKEDSNTLAGLYNSMRSLGMVAGSLFAGFIYEVGPRLSFVCSALGFLIGCIFAAAMAVKCSKQKSRSTGF